MLEIEFKRLLDFIMLCTSYIVWHHVDKLHLKQRRVSEFVKLDVQDFDLFWRHILIPFFLTFCDWFWPVKMRPHGWWVGFLLPPTIAQFPVASQTNGTSWPLKMEANFENCSPNDTASHPIKLSVLQNNAMRTWHLAHSVLVLQTSCYVPYCSIQTWRLRYQWGQTSCCEWEWRLLQHFCKLLL